MRPCHLSRVYHQQRLKSLHPLLFLYQLRCKRVHFSIIFKGCVCACGHILTYKYIMSFSCLVMNPCINSSQKSWAHQLTSIYHFNKVCDHKGFGRSHWEDEKGPLFYSAEDPYSWEGGDRSQGHDHLCHLWRGFHSNPWVQLHRKLSKSDSAAELQTPSPGWRAFTNVAAELAGLP